MLEPCNRCFYTIMANYNGSLEAVDCRIHAVRYGMVLECMPADISVSVPCQVTYDVVAMPIRPKNA
eukprot:scaffold4116_cov178-Skeletonema_dohrnii-CCMP3373.AAC.3